MQEQTIQQIALAFVSLMQVVSVFVSSRNHAKLTKLQNGSADVPARQSQDSAQGILPLK